MSSWTEGQGLLIEVMLIIFEWASEALIQAKPSGSRRRSEGAIPSPICWLVKDFGGQKLLSGEEWSRRIQEGKILKSSNISKTRTRLKGSSRWFQQSSFHINGTPYEKVIAFCSIRSTGKFGKKRCHVAPLTRWHVASVLYKHDDVAPLIGWHMVSIQYGPITRWLWHDDMACYMAC